MRKTMPLQTIAAADLFRVVTIPSPSLTSFSIISCTAEWATGARRSWRVRARDEMRGALVELGSGREMKDFLDREEAEVDG